MKKTIIILAVLTLISCEKDQYTVQCGYDRPDGISEGWLYRVKGQKNVEAAREACYETPGTNHTFESLIYEY
jgi:hypothetical protein